MSEDNIWFGFLMMSFLRVHHLQRQIVFFFEILWAIKNIGSLYTFLTFCIIFEILGAIKHRISSKLDFVNLTKLRSELPSFESNSEITLSPWLIPFFKKSLCHHLHFRFSVFTAIIMMKAAQAPAVRVSSSTFFTKLILVWTRNTVINMYPDTNRYMYPTNMLPTSINMLTTFYLPACTRP